MWSIFRVRYLQLWLIALLLPLGATGQLLIKDSIQFSKLQIKNSKFFNRLFQQAINSIKREPPPPGFYVGRSEDPYLPYHGKVIRHIDVKALSFNQSFKDTCLRDTTRAIKLANRFHTNTKKSIVRSNLFIRENTELNAFKVADNERFIRSLDYINDVRFVIHELPGNPDSVDITVITKDLFSLGGGAAADGFNHLTANLYDANVAGLGQRIEISGLYDYNRSPDKGYGALYRKRNILGSFIDGTVGFSTMNISPYTHQEENAAYLTLSRPLISPYTKLAGAFNLSRNYTYNRYNAPELIFYRYRYDYIDAWAGYNIAIEKLTATNNTIRDRRFLSFRYFNRKFVEVPKQVGDAFNPFYNNAQALLAQITFFRQDYYRTQYIYGFGTTEDLPYGYNIAVTAGWHKQLNLERPYAGVTASQYLATNRGDFLQFYLRSGGFLSDGQLQDASILVGATAYSRLFFINSTKVRQYINASFTVLHNRLTSYPLRLNNPFGLRGFLSDSAYGDRRLTAQFETVFYLKFKLLGFQFAPFPFADISLLASNAHFFSNPALYASLGGGIRTRNENLVFETMEIRAYFFPVAPDNMKGFKIVTSANLRYRYPSSLITAPDIVQLN